MLGPSFSITALRTETHKLITYDGRKEWTELFNIADDPYEIQNLSTNTVLLNSHLEKLEAAKKSISLP
jgi:hypothetical protein